MTFGNPVTQLPASAITPGAFGAGVTMPADGLTTGALAATFTLTGSIHTAAAGARVEIDAAGVRAYSAAGQNTVDIKSSDGSVTIVGNLATGFTGQRVVTNNTELLFYSGLAGETPAYIYADPTTYSLQIMSIMTPTETAAPSIGLQTNNTTGYIQIQGSTYFVDDVTVGNGLSGAGGTLTISGSVSIPSGALNVAGVLNATNTLNAVGGLTVGGGGLFINGAGIAYPGATVGGGTANQMGMRWASPNIVGTVDNAVSAVLGTASDRRLKADVAPLTTTAAELLRQLRPITYAALDLDGSRVDDKRHHGLIADELAAVLPELVTGEATDETFQSVNYAGLTPILVAGFQLLDARLTTLERTHP